MKVRRRKPIMRYRRKHKRLSGPTGSRMAVAVSADRAAPVAGSAHFGSTSSLAAKGLLKPDGRVAIDRATSELRMSKAELAETVGLAAETLQRSARVEAPKTQARLREMLEIVAHVSSWAGGWVQAMAWYRAEPIPAFGGRTAESLVKEGRAAAVRDYLDGVALGSFA
jgi:hypothetical protein